MKPKTHLKLHSEALLEELESRQLFSGGIEGLLVNNDQTEAATYMDVDSGNAQTVESDNNGGSPQTADTLRPEYE